ncbi:MAG: DUF2007 domain-containing protein [Chthoniobacteraceae bacterium]
MTTIHRFRSVWEAGYACSLLEAFDVEAELFDEFAYTMGPQYVPWGIRLLVAEEDIETARTILNHEGVVPLPDDFVPPPDPNAAHEPFFAGFSVAHAFLKGACFTFLILFGFHLAAPVRPHYVRRDDPGMLVLFLILGGFVGIFTASPPQPPRPGAD